MKKERVHRLLALAGEMSAAYRRRFLGTMSPVLWEKRREDGRWEGLTDTYVRVRAAADADLTNRLTAARLTALDEDGLYAEVMA